MIKKGLTKDMADALIAQSVERYCLYYKTIFVKLPNGVMIDGLPTAGHIRKSRRKKGATIYKVHIKDLFTWLSGLGYNVPDLDAMNRLRNQVFLLEREIDKEIYDA